MPQKTFHYSNGDITVEWKPELCIHSTICFKGLGEVFDPRKRPWIDMSAAGTAQIINQVKKCPSGALSYTVNEKPPVSGPSPQLNERVQLATIECLKNGPYLVREMVTIRKPDGSEETRVGSTALCRCGASGNKPYCDGSHNKVGFEG
ncbi:MAG: (4Fe-4S)-binding protein [Chitinophagaceae bacterium]